VFMPMIDVLHQQVHHEIPGELFDIEVLQQEAAVAVVEAGEFRGSEGHVKPTAA